MKNINAIVKKSFHKYNSQEMIPVGTKVNLMPYYGTPGDPNGYVQYSLPDGYSSRFWGIPNAIINEYFSIEHATAQTPQRNADGFTNNTEAFQESWRAVDGFRNADGFNNATAQKKDMLTMLKSVPTVAYVAGTTGAVVGAAIAHKMGGGWISYLFWSLGLGATALVVTDAATSTKKPAPAPKKDALPPVKTATLQTGSVTKDAHSNFVGTMNHKVKHGTGEIGYIPVPPANAQVGNKCGQGYGTWADDGSGGMYCMSNAHAPKALS